ncbi:unnamed protein product [Didymodactylos carnosus]|uniref:Uncharacterized protein n=1 Tax=Didymodactylos carnosus TaxID=1234261 RepID=A0A816BCW5_9BILA|nr:unnamed protein product [Didymodactylos carnosus]CAF4488130.1 unnamed protein product [Didymodactylos carnosus]
MAGPPEDRPCFKNLKDVFTQLQFKTDETHKVLQDFLDHTGVSTNSMNRWTDKILHKDTDHEGIVGYFCGLPVIDGNQCPADDIPWKVFVGKSGEGLSSKYIKFNSAAEMVSFITANCEKRDDVSDEKRLETD